MKHDVSRRELLTGAGIASVAAVVDNTAKAQSNEPQQQSFQAEAGQDRIVVLNGRTYLRGWAGYGERPRRKSEWQINDVAAASIAPDVKATWSKVSGPGEVKFADPNAFITTATFSARGDYLLKLTGNSGKHAADATLKVTVEPPPPPTQLGAVYTRRFQVDSAFWNPRFQSLVVNWIPHCIDVISRNDVTLGQGGIDNFVEAGKKLRGEPAG